MTKLKKIIFKQLIFFLSFFYKVDNKVWLISLSHGGGSYEAENCKTFAFFLKKKKINFKCVSNKSIKGLEKHTIKPFSLNYVYYSLISKVIIVENDLHNDLPGYRSKDTYKVNLFHGMAVKKIYHSSKLIGKYFDKIFLNYLRKLFVGFCFTDEYDLISVTGNYHRKKYISAFQNKNVKILGQPRNDFFFKEQKNLKREILKKLQIKRSVKKIILYLPTFRDFEDHLSINRFFFENKNLEKELKRRKTILLFKGHFFHKKIEKNKFSKFSDNIFNLNQLAPTYQLMKISDCLVTDYSSVYIDYLLLNKPIFFYCYDIKHYKTKNREIYFNYFKDIFTPGKKIIKRADMSRCIINFLKNKKDNYKIKRKRSKNLFHLSQDQNSSKRIYEHIYNTLK